MNVHQENLQRDDCVLILIDIQKVLLDPCVDADPVRKNAGALLEVAKVFALPVLFTVHNGDKLGGALPELLDKAPSAQVIDKLEFSGLEDAAIAEAVRQCGRRTLLITGIESHVCVFHTGVHALRLGYRVHIAADAVSSRSAVNRQIGINRLGKAGAIISSTEMMTYELLQRAGTPEFRTLLPLLKTLQ
jgi:nicotinamidase-related amidase